MIWSDFRLHILSIFRENGILRKQLNDERSNILILEEKNEKLTKGNKNKKLVSQQKKVKYHFRAISGQVKIYHLGNE